MLTWLSARPGVPGAAAASAAAASAAAASAAGAAGSWVVLWRRCALLLVLLGGLACLPAALLGSTPPAPSLRAGYPRLVESWGPVVARSWARGALLLPLPGASHANGCADAMCGVLPSWLSRRLAGLLAGIDAWRAWPLRLGCHLWALSLWLGLLHPLAWSVLQWRQQQAAASADRGPLPEHGACVGQAGSAGPFLVMLTLAWTALPPGSERWAPGVAGVWLLVRALHVLHVRRTPDIGA